jgi:hypothetical protein
LHDDVLDDAAGIAGSDAYRLFASLLGVGYFLLPMLAFALAGNALREESAGFTALMGDPDPAVAARAFAAMMKMKRLDVDALRAAARA